MAELDQAQRADTLRQLEEQYRQFKSAGLKLDLTRGKPSTEQVALSDPIDHILGDEYVLADGTDVRNYGGLDGLAEARRLGAEILAVKPEDVIVGGNGSLTLMYQMLLLAWLHGVPGGHAAWRKDTRPIKFLCPVPGYDRHFTMCVDLGIEMINVGMTDAGPDMDQIEDLVKHDPSIRGIWCVPKYSNPTGHVYSDAVVERFARLGLVAGPGFRIMWDNAYAVHDLDEHPPALANLMELSRRFGTEDNVVTFGSTSKITRAGAGIGFLGASARNLDALRKHMGVYTIGPDKVTQLRHVRFLKDLAGVRALMRRHATLLRPKFDTVLRHLDTGLRGQPLGRWTRPRGGYFISFDAKPGLAREIVRLAGEAGVKLTPAGATFPYGKDPDDANIRLAPTFPRVDDVDQAMRVFVLCVRLATAKREMGG